MSILHPLKPRLKTSHTKLVIGKSLFFCVILNSVQLFQRNHSMTVHPSVSKSVRDIYNAFHFSPVYNPLFLCCLLLTGCISACLSALLMDSLS